MTHDLALGEMQALCTKAARGAGRAFGVSGDAGLAVRWLSARGINGADALATLLRATDGRVAADLAPDLPRYSPAKLAICPLTLGGYLSDIGAVPTGPIGPVWTPMLLEPFVADLSAIGVEVVATYPSEDPALIHLVPRSTHTSLPRHTRAQVSTRTMNVLLNFAARTYAPATEHSRAQGAGAGLSDND